tara:strand:+ start:1064 stop:3472 length:2409 start_codon:yes stop_codon:yes gene_type:complete
MADAKKQLKELNGQIDALYKRLGRMDTPPIFKAAEIGAARREIQKLKVDLDEVNNSLSYISKSFRDSIAELSSQNTELGYAKKSLKSIEKISRDIAYENQQGLIIDDKKLASLEKKAKLEYQSLKIAIDSGRITGATLKEFQDNLKTADEFAATMTRIRETTKKIKGDVGVKTFGFMDDLTKKIPGLSALSDPFKEANEAAQQTAKSNLDLFGSTKPLQKQQLDGLKEAAKTGKGLTQNKIKELGLEKMLVGSNGKKLAGLSANLKASKLLGGASAAKGAISPLKAGLKVLGPALTKMLTKALGPVGLLIELFAAIKQSDKIVSDMAKNFGMSYDAALGMKKEMTNVAMSSGSVFVTSKGISETFSAINTSLGTNAMLSEDMAVEFTKLRTMAGFTNEELVGISNLMLGTNKTTDEITGQFIAQAKVSALQNGVLLNEQQLLKGIGKVSAATTLSFGKQPGLIADAVSTAKSLGMELSKVDAIAGSLLDFESSIENELQAELLLGKDINLEKARQAALNNDLATVAKEISTQIGSSAEFSKMNRIQQEALAKAVGMGREDLAQTLLLEDKLKGLTAEKAAAATKDFETLKAKVGEQEAMRILEERGAAGLKKQVGMADKFNASMEKMKEIFVVVGEAIMPLLDMMASIFTIIGPLLKILNPIITAALMPLMVTIDAVEAIIYGAKKLMNFFGASFDTSEFAFGKNTISQGNKMMDSVGVDSSKHGMNEQKFNGDEMFMAKGGIVNGPTRAIVGEAGPEAVIPLSDNSPMIKQANKTNDLLEALLNQQSKQPQLSSIGLYEVQ